MIRARDVTVACRLAMAEARVRLPLGALDQFKVQNEKGKCEISFYQFCPFILNFELVAAPVM